MNLAPFQRVAWDASPRQVLTVVERMLPKKFRVLVADLRGSTDDVHFIIGKLSTAETRDYSDLTGRDVTGDEREDAEERRSSSVHILSSYERTGHTIRVDRQPSRFEVGDVVIAGGDCWRVLRKLTKYRGHGCELYVDRVSNRQVERALRGVNL